MKEIHHNRFNSSDNDNIKYYGQFYANKFDNFNEIDKLLENTLPKLLRDRTDNLNSHLLNKVKLLSKTSPKEKSWLLVLLVKSIKYLRKKYH